MHPNEPYELGILAGESIVIPIQFLLAMHLLVLFAFFCLENPQIVPTRPRQGPSAVTPWRKVCC
jgi:hypothetical protein